MTKHLLITGGCGFIGTNFVRFVLEHRPHWQVTNLDALTYAGSADNLADQGDNPAYQFVHGDIRDAELVGRLADGCDAIVHIAAHTHVDRSILDPRPFLDTNIMGTQTLLEAARAAGGRRFVHVSTDEVYGDLPLDRPDLSFTEQSPIKPSSPYSASKAAADMITLAYHRTFELDTVITRCSNNFGPYQFPEKVIPLFVTNLLEGKKVPLYGDGQNVRDWLHVDDHCEAILAALEHGEAGQVYNVGGGNEKSNLELTHAIIAIMGLSDDMIEQVSDRPGHDRRYAVDNTKIREQLGWSPSRSAWPEALATTVQWYIDHQSWCITARSSEFGQYYEQQYGLRT